MQTTKLSWSICDEVDRNARRFLWGGSSDRRTIHNVSWDQLVKSKEDGGLGLRQMKQVNWTFLTKLGWKTLTEKHSLWARVLRAKYCKGNEYLIMFMDRQDASNAWRGIIENVQFVPQVLELRLAMAILHLFGLMNGPYNNPSSLSLITLLHACLIERFDSGIKMRKAVASILLPTPSMQ